MADPFAVRMRFTTFLQHLSASVASSQKTAHFALKNRELDEDLHSCILEQLERSHNNLNNRANIMYFIEQLCELAIKEKHLDFVRMIQRDIPRIVDAVAPADGIGVANIKHVRRVLYGLQAKNVLSKETVEEINQSLKERESLATARILLELPADDNDEAAFEEASKSGAGGGGGGGGGGNQSGSNSATPAPPPLMKVDKRQIEQRIEEDRERNKRLRENEWTVPGNDEEEFDTLWDEGSDLGEDDYRTALEESTDRERIALEFEFE